MTDEVPRSSGADTDPDRAIEGDRAARLPRRPRAGARRSALRCFHEAIFRPSELVGDRVDQSASAHIDLPANRTVGQDIWDEDISRRAGAKIDPDGELEFRKLLAETNGP